TFWTRTDIAADFVQQDPENGAPATERTEVRVAYDARRLLLGVTCLDSEPSRLLGNQMQRDQPLTADDRFMISIDPHADGRSGYFFQINPSGRMDGGDRNSVPHALLRSRVERVGDQLSAHGAAPQRREPVERVAAQPGTD